MSGNQTGHSQDTHLLVSAGKMLRLKVTQELATETIWRLPHSHICHLGQDDPNAELSWDNQPKPQPGLPPGLGLPHNMVASR